MMIARLDLAQANAGSTNASVLLSTCARAVTSACPRGRRERRARHACGKESGRRARAAPHAPHHNNEGLTTLQWA